MGIRSDLVSAAMLLTRLPVRGTPTPRAAQAAWAWPLMGAVVGLPAGLLGMGVAAMGLPGGLAAAATLAALVVLTGALHEDGLADVADGFWGGFTPERRLEIMRDSRIGAYGVIALVLSLLARWLLLETALSQGNLLGAALVAGLVSRAPMAVLMTWLPPARQDGLAQGTGTPSRLSVSIGLGLAGAALLTQGLPHALLGATLAAIGAAGVSILARRKIGGHTGDVLGTCQQICEIAVLAALVAR
ncbi:adenosylcobinamide-GDP ribazoletransferase [Jannaschia pagri]|uniref:Adenosylcobinamide-GDP ribazoletransferase n=1 Tax=Jannaschia pagri TaxID=2829797 RepID=A0ABQ4NHW9_9RHOB|nr:MULTISPECIES: adenosylcobinamide-GDP ribazoletransferase [unclassified Jannaschia]GIT89866.1 adenosylcobinamide-GDP ribazoletransferase [Jannaschia sp. AI_61]GIT94027.1 adenosylcobinamide-GDP ribazoletransferase [Jannaschia sp. AI_62]